jgi:hypothetical protein
MRNISRSEKNEIELFINSFLSRIGAATISDDEFQDVEFTRPLTQAESKELHDAVVAKFGRCEYNATSRKGAHIYGCTDNLLKSKYGNFVFDSYSS